MKKHILLATLLLFFSVGIFAQVKKQDKKLGQDKVHVETIEGNDFIGKVISEDRESIKLKTDNLGEISIRKSDIKKREAVSEGQIVGNEYWFSNPNSTRYLFAPNAYALKKGEGYYQNTWVFMNQVSYGFTNKFTLGLGTVPLFLFGSGTGAEITPFWITPKYTFGGQDANSNVSAGIFYFFFPFARRDAGGALSAGIAYANGTIGDRNRNLSFGLGYGFSRNGNLAVARTSFAKYPTFNLSGMYRVSKKGYFISENWFLSSGDFNLGILTAAYRHVGKSMSIDMGLVGIASGDYTGPIAPWLGVLIPFSVKSATK